MSYRKIALAPTLAADLRVAVGRLARRLREQAQLGDLTWSQVWVLGRLERDGPATISALARAEGMRPQSMGANVAALEAAGFVQDAADPRDGRQTLWSLAPAGREWLRVGRAAREDWLSHAIEQALSAKEQEQLARAVALLQRLVGP